MRRVLAALVAMLIPTFSHAWGPLGHRMVAETAALLVADDLPDGWGPLIARHRFELGVYSFLPDSLFRHIDGAGGATEGPTHFLSLDAAEGAVDRGTLDRRIAQLAGMARAELAPVTKPEGGYGPGASATGDARRVFTGLFDLGLLSHYTGDAAVPYHATADSNAYARGEGGIHFYFEGDCVNALEPGLAADVLARARKHRARWLAEWGGASGGTGPLVLSVLRDSLAAVGAVSKLDRRHAILSPSRPDGKVPARRKPAIQGCREMRSVLVDRLARGAVLTAAVWESALPAGVDFGGAAGLQFSDMHLAPDYVAPP